MSPQNTYKGIPDWKLERYILGELPQEEIERIRRETENSTLLRERLDVLKQSNQDIHSRYPPGWVSRQIREKTNRMTQVDSHEEGSFGSRFWPLPALVAVAVLLLVAVPTLFIPRGDRDIDSEIRVKGHPHLLLYRKTNTGIEHLKDGSLVQENDLIQVSYQAAGRRYGVILSIDGRDSVTLHLPYDGGQAVQLKEGKSVPLDFAYKLDDAPEWERFYLITSDTPFAVDVVMQAARQMLSQGRTAKGDSLDVPDSFNQYIFTLRKRMNR